MRRAVYGRSRLGWEGPFWDAQAMSNRRHDDTYDEDEAKRRFEAALRAALNTPPKPHKDEPKKRPRRGAAAPGRDRAAPSSDGAPSPSSSPRGGRGRP